MTYFCISSIVNISLHPADTWIQNLSGIQWDHYCKSCHVHWWFSSTNNNIIYGYRTTMIKEEQHYFSSSTGGLLMRVMRLQYQIMMMRMLGVRNVFMANQTLVKPPFWWMLLEEKHTRVSATYSMLCMLFIASTCNILQIISQASKTLYPRFFLLKSNYGQNCHTSTQLCASKWKSKLQVPRDSNAKSQIKSQLTTRRMSLISPIPTLTFLRSLTGRRMLRR